MRRCTENPLTGPTIPEMRVNTSERPDLTRASPNLARLAGKTRFPFYLVQPPPDWEERREQPTESEVDRELVRRAQKGDDEAMRLVLRSVTPRLLRLATRLCSSPSIAEDLVEEALYRGGLKLHRLQHAEALPSWFRSILITAWKDHLRSARRRHLPLLEQIELPVAGVSTDPVERARESETRERIAVALASLPTGQRAVLTLWFEEGLGIPEIAAELESTTDRVKANLYHARRKLRRKLHDLLDKTPLDVAPLDDAPLEEKR